MFLVEVIEFRIIKFQVFGGSNSKPEMGVYVCMCWEFRMRAHYTRFKSSFSVLAILCCDGKIGFLFPLWILQAQAFRAVTGKP